IPLPHHAAKSEMARRRVDRFGVAGGGGIGPAVVSRAAEGATPDDLARNPDFGLAGIEALLGASAARIPWNAARLRRVGLVPRGIPVGGPFPDIADHVVDAVSVRR